MAERKPLVLINGQLQELPVGDTLPGSGGLQNNYAATTAPTVTDDSASSYSVGSQWVDVTNDNSYICADASVGAAVWVQTNGSGGGSMTDAEVKTAYENNPDTNAFTDALLNKLGNIEANATADQTGAEIVSAIDTELGQTDWKTGGGGGGISEAPTDGKQYARKVGAWSEVDLTLWGADQQFNAHSTNIANSGATPTVRVNLYTAKKRLRISGMTFRTASARDYQMFVATVDPATIGANGVGTTILEVRGTGGTIIGPPVNPTEATLTMTNPAIIEAGEKFIVGAIRLTGTDSGIVRTTDAAPNPYENDDLSSDRIRLEYNATTASSVAVDNSGNGTLFYMDLDYATESEIVFEAPKNGSKYVRKDGAWALESTGGGGGSSVTPFEIAHAETTWRSDGGSPFDANLPADIQSGDALMLIIPTNGSGNTLTTPAGWALENFFSGTLSCVVFTRTADGGEGATVSIATSAGVNVHHNVHAIRVRGADISGGFFVASDDEYNSASESAFPPEVQVPWSSALLISVGITNPTSVAGVVEFNAPTGMTALGSTLDAGSGFSQVVKSLAAYKELGHGGAAGGDPFTFKYTSSGLSAPFPKPTRGVTLVLKRQGDTLDAEPRVEGDVETSVLNSGESTSDDTETLSVKGMGFLMTETRHLTEINIGMAANATYKYRVYVVETERGTTPQDVQNIVYRSPELLGPYTSGSSRLVHRPAVPIRLEKGRVYAIVIQSLDANQPSIKTASVNAVGRASNGFEVLYRVRRAVTGHLTTGQIMYDNQATAVDMILKSVSESAILDMNQKAVVGKEEINFSVDDTMLSGGVIQEVDTTNGAITITVPRYLTGEQPVTFEQIGTNDVTFVAGHASVTINSYLGNLKLAGQYASAILIPKGSETYSLVGDLKA